MWKNGKKFFIFIGVFLGISLLLSLIIGFLLTYFYESTGYKGSPLIGTFVSVVSAVLAILIAYKPFKKKIKS
ncbi:hypothetical protein [Bacillus sp. KH172YL63]|uniref:hypothetical protein n=1 Tax=Bacillus sp. KH172YL63 TaxID=2709784 RepID=UPI0013E4DC77|nr:hypothetical protein [Bacillus sp. KH172YL63]BCB04329.1 hypothetical protein KH172YL63_24620 [Bacillus sp. KH172YL63]